MLEVVFHDSAKAGLIQAWRMQGNACGVIGLSLYLDVGDVSGDLFGARREAELRRLFCGPGGEEAARELMAVNRADRDRLLEAAAQGDPARLWYSDSPGEACGLLHAVSLLAGLPCPILAVKLPHLRPVPDGWRRFASWNDVPPGAFADFAGGQRLLDGTERRALAAQWRQLARENAPLRAVLNGGVRSVPDAFYDFLIDRHMPEGEFVEAQLIGRILGETPMGLPDGWFARRIDGLVASGALQVTQPARDGHPYSRRLMRTPRDAGITG